MAKKSDSHSGPWVYDTYLPGGPGRARHIREDLARKEETLPLLRRGGVNKGIQTAPLAARPGLAGAD